LPSAQLIFLLDVYLATAYFVSWSSVGLRKQARTCNYRHCFLAASASFGQVWMPRFDI